jgi:hypothetical protein
MGSRQLREAPGARGRRRPPSIERFWQVYFRVYFVDTTLASTMNLNFTENTIKNGNAVAGHILNSVGEPFCASIREFLSRRPAP